MWGQGTCDPAHALLGPEARAEEGICRGRMGKGRSVLNRVTSIVATNRKQGRTADGTSTDVGTCLINKWRAKIHQERLYKVKVNALRKELRKMAKNQSLLARLLEKDS